nr:NAD+ synthase [Kangiella shandongensis]
MRIALAQNNYIVGDIKYNLQLIKNSVIQAEERNADIVVFSELALCGYPPEDLLLRPDLYLIVDKALEEIKSIDTRVAMVIGHPRRQGTEIYNSASFIHNGECLLCYDKQLLPNYEVFDEKRYFTAGSQCPVVEFKGVKISLLICEDLWFKEPAKVAKLAGAELILSPNASPYYHGKAEVRGQEMASRASENNIPVVYVNQIGGQDELIFDGCSSAYNSNGECVFMAAEMAEDFACIDFDKATDRLTSLEQSYKQWDDEEEIWQALVLGVKDYVRKNGFPGALLGLSGGIDSAVTLAVAVDALGKENVNAVMMPYRYTASMSVEDAQAESEALGVEFDIISIEPICDAFMQQMQPQLEGTEPGVTEQNIQARCRGTILMGLSNKFGRLVLTTGNKSEVAVGYCTLYGDMAGGLDVLKDVPKTMVYQLARYRNTVSPVIPERVITRPPSAELAPEQVDEDNLPPYEVLDEILEAYVEHDKSISDIVSLGHDEETVRKVIRLVDINEHKRRQAPIGIRISSRAFGRDRRYPITSGFGRQFK